MAHHSAVRVGNRPGEWMPAPGECQLAGFATSFVSFAPVFLGPGFCESRHFVDFRFLAAAQRVSVPWNSFFQSA